MKGKIFLDKEPAPSVQIFESDATGKPLFRNNKIISAVSDINGNFNLNIPSGENFFVTFRLVGTKPQTYKTNKTPSVINLQTTGNLEIVTVTAKQTFYWLIPVALFLLIAVKKNKL
jgi:hypothetical protein